MNYTIEFIGYPGSGKTKLAKKIKYEFLKFKLNIIKSDKYFFEYYSKNILDSLSYKAYYSYKIKKKFASKVLFKKNYFFLKKKINSIVNYNHLNKIIKNYKNLLNYTNLNKEGKARSIENFKIDLCSYFLKKKKETFILYNDEGLFQRVYQDYNYNLNFEFIKKKILEYLNSIPSPDLVIRVKSSFKNAVYNAKIRNKGFVYTKNFTQTNKNFIEINKLLKKILKKKKIKTIDLNFNKINSNKIKLLKKETLKKK